MEAPDKKNNQKKKIEKNIFEWVIFFTSVVLIIATIGYLAYKTITYKPSPPEIGVKYIPDPSPHAGYRYHLTITNTGGGTAEEVQIELVLMKAGNIWEKAELQLPFIPQSSKRESWVNFSHDPNLADSVYTRVISFKKP